MSSTAQSKPARKQRRFSLARDLVWAGAGVAGVTLLALALAPVTGYLSIALLYLLLVVVAGLQLSQTAVLSLAAVSGFVWNFLFIPPRFTLYIHSVQDGMMFAMFVVVAVAMGHLTARLGRSQAVEQQRERRTAALYELAHQAAFAPELDAGLRAAVAHIESIVGAKAALLLRLADHTLGKTAHGASSFALTEAEVSVAAWAFDHRRVAGRGTESFADAAALHLPLQARTAVMGVLCVKPDGGRAFDASERELLEAFAVLIGLLLEKDHIAAAIRRAEVLETSERLRRSILDTVSHELKTPLAAVQAGLSALERQADNPLARAATVSEMQIAVRRLNRVVSNVLEMTRIEAGAIRLKLDWCDLAEVVDGAVELAADALAKHRLAIAIDEALPMVKLDHRLIEQALANLLANAAHWSPPGAMVKVQAEISDGVLSLAVVDQGPGIAEAELPHVFEKFYRGAQAPSGGTGLGLAIVDGFVRAHGGGVRALNRAGGGAEFHIHLPVEVLNEQAMELDN